MHFENKKTRLKLNTVELKLLTILLATNHEDIDRYDESNFQIFQ